MVTSFRIGRIALGLMLVVSLQGADPARLLAGPLDATWRRYASPGGDAYPFSLIDPARRRVLMLSEASLPCGPKLWSADLDSATAWAPLATSGEAPNATLLGAVVDPPHDRLVAWGGSPFSTQGTWELSLSTMVWTRVSDGSPTYAGSGVVYDPTGERALVLCGFSYSSYGTPSGSNSVVVLDLSGTPTWSGLGPSGARPTLRGDVTAVFDARRNRVLMYGGRYVLDAYNRVLPPLDEVWELSLGASPAWRFIPPAAPLPSARWDCKAYVDSLGDRMWVYGGKDAAGKSLGNDLWSLSLADTDTARWVHTGSSGPASARPPAAGAWDPVRRILVFGGGSVADAQLVTHWYTQGGRFQLSLSGAPTWSTPVPDGIVPAKSGQLVLDPARSRVVTLGNVISIGTSDAIWSTPIRQPPAWSCAAVASGLPLNGTAIADPVHDRVVVFGGRMDTGVALNGTWVLPLTGGGVVPLPNYGGPPPARGACTAVLDAAGDRMIVYGGSTASGGKLTYLEDVWALSLTAPCTWTRLDLTGPRPPARGDAAAVLDSIGRRLVIYGGTDTLGIRHDMWAFSLDQQTWTALNPVGVAPSVGPATYDGSRRRMLMLGGFDASMSAPVVNVLSLTDPPVWSVLATQGCGAGAWPGIAYDAPNDRLIVSSDSRLWALYMQDWTTPVTAALVSASADAAGAHLVWSLADVAGPVTIERRADAGAWSDVATRTPDGVGRLRFDDPSVESGHAYDYRLRVGDGTSAVCVGSASVRVPPATSTLAFAAAPNPAGTTPRFVVRLPAEVREARIELFDLAGRRVRVQRLTTGGGPATADLTTGGALAPGVYRARLVADGTVRATVRLAVVR